MYRQGFSSRWRSGRSYPYGSRYSHARIGFGFLHRPYGLHFPGFFRTGAPCWSYSRRHYYHTSITVGFGFYGGCLWRPRLYPVYYPLYYPPVFVTPVTYRSYPRYVTSETYVVTQPIIEPEVIREEVVIEVPVRQAPRPDLSPEALQAMMAEATRLFEQGKYEQAARLFQEAATADPNNVDAGLAHAVARFATGDYALSAASIRHGIALLPEIVDSVFDLRDRYGGAEEFEAQLKEFERHLSALETWVEQHAEDIDAHVVLGFVYHFTGQRAWAAEVFRWVKQNAGTDTALADTFLNAKPLPDMGPTDGQQDPATPDPQVPGEPAGGIAPASEGTGPSAAAREAAEGLRVSVVEPLDTKLVYHGFVSRDDETWPKEVLTIDGIMVKVKDTDPDPLDADLEVRVDGRKEDYQSVPVGASIDVFGRSGHRYRLDVVDILDETETVRFAVVR